MEMIIPIVVGLVCGGIIGWFISYLKFGDLKVISSELRRQIEQSDKTINTLRDNLESVTQAKTVAETRFQEEGKNIEEQKRLLEKAQEKLTTTFQALSGESLKSNNRAFLELARENLEVVLKEAKGEFVKKEEAIKNIVKPLEDVLNKYEKQINEMEKSRVGAYVNLESQVKALVSSEQQLQKETGNLVTALRKPEVRGRWGEVTLKRVVELAGMTEHCDYTEQVSVNTEDGRLRPDMIVHLPGDREIVVDSKVSLSAYLDAIASDSEEQKKTFILKHAQQVRKHMKDLSSKSYWDQFPKAPEHVVMFMPGESFYRAAVESDHTLIEDGMKSKVLIASPINLMGLLGMSAYDWRQELIAKNAQKIADLGKEIYDRLQPFLEHVSRVGSSLNNSVAAFNKMQSSLETRVMVSARKFKELGAAGDKELPEVKSIEQVSLKSQSREKIEEK